MNELYISQLCTIALVHLLAVASPGPDFAIIVRQSISHGRATALWSSLGVACGILIHVCYCLLGIGVIVSQSILAFTLMKLVGACYLFYLGIRCLAARPQNQAILVGEKACQTPTIRQAIWTGFLTNGLNPKATLFFLSLFTVVIQPATPLPIQVGYGLYMAVATGIWFSLLSLFFGHAPVRSSFLKIGHWFERLTGAVLILLGLKLATTANH
ncbi:LysE family transporter [Desulfogranum mediterraneum]|uniref:LysE family transporter n=1 Tax=Desulfogranum mediterraneum TaxID=160661 RepID=UPI00042188B1|nr:LysE family transporter [Desulfogranum mediterraneum]